MSICSNKSKDFSEQCAYIWIPDKGHGELEVGSKIFNLVCGEKSPHQETEEMWRANSLVGFSSPYFRFQIAISSEEKKRIIQEMDHLGIHTCSGNVAVVLRKVTGISLPRFSSMFPSKLAKHLYQMSKAPNSRVSKPEYIGPTDYTEEFDRLFSKSVSESEFVEYVAAVILIPYLVWIIIQWGQSLYVTPEQDGDL